MRSHNLGISGLAIFNFHSDVLFDKIWWSQVEKIANYYPLFYQLFYLILQDCHPDKIRWSQATSEGALCREAPSKSCPATNIHWFDSPSMPGNVRRNHGVYYYSTQEHWYIGGFFFQPHVEVMIPNECMMLFTGGETTKLQLLFLYFKSFGSNLFVVLIYAPFDWLNSNFSWFKKLCTSR